MDRGGIETWLMHLLRRINCSALTFDFLVETARPGMYDGEIRQFGARIIHCERTRHLWSYGRRLARTLKRAGPFDVVHCHSHYFSGLVLAVSAMSGVPLRIAHSHTDMRSRSPDLARRLYYSALRASLRRHMTHGIAVSDGSARELFGANYEADTRVQVLPCGIDYSPFLAEACRSDARRELGIPEDAAVIGHVGRFDPEKNHQLLIDAFAMAAQQHARLHLLLVGGGVLKPTLERHILQLGLQTRVTFAGITSDVPSSLRAMDAFAFPSKYEGLPLALIEAQAAGLPIVISNTIPGDALIQGHWIRRLPLGDRNAWATAVLDAVALPDGKRTRSFDPRFDIDLNLAALLKVYRLATAPVSLIGHSSPKSTD
jgi:glycosyltransferase involved in cell wall biosynthesis